MFTGARHCSGRPYLWCMLLIPGGRARVYRCAALLAAASFCARVKNGWDVAAAARLELVHGLVGGFLRIASAPGLLQHC